MHQGAKSQTIENERQRSGLECCGLRIDAKPDCDGMDTGKREDLRNMTEGQFYIMYVVCAYALTDMS